MVFKLVLVVRLLLSVFCPVAGSWQSLLPADLIFSFSLHVLIILAHDVTVT